MSQVGRQLLALSRGVSASEATQLLVSAHPPGSQTFAPSRFHPLAQPLRPAVGLAETTPAVRRGAPFPSLHERVDPGQPPGASPPTRQLGALSLVPSIAESPPPTQAPWGVMPEGSEGRRVLYLKFDGGARGNPGLAGAGAHIFLESDPLIELWWGSMFVGEYVSNNVAE